ncbi:MAG TPA: class I adenylate-forming enzyme family protein [Luteitalea sp.]|nr:class I adenylate-forming enzyme family protein [Luteitalea sp.]
MAPTSELAAAFEAVLRDRADAPLLIAPSEGRTCTAHDLHDAAGALATTLRAAGLTRGHLIVAGLGNIVALPALVLACLREGWPLMPADRSMPLAELRALAGRWDAAALVVPGSAHETSDEAPASTSTWASARSIETGGITILLHDPMPEPGRHAPAAVLKLTSGTTGAPRATCSEERHLIADVRHITDVMRIGPSTRQLGAIPLSHSYGFGNLLLPLLWQGSPLLLRPQFVPTQIVPDLQAWGLDTFAGVPFMFDHLARHRRLPPLPSLRLVLSAGARLPFEIVEAFHAATGCKIRSFYGSSETGGICFDDTPTVDPRVPVGRPMGATAIALVDDDDAPPGSGRVRVSGPNVIERYAVPMDGAGDEADSRGPLTNGAFLTSDYARRDDDGLFVLTGRAASFVNVAGRKVVPQEVEAILLSLPGVAEAVALAVEDPVRGQALGACLVSAQTWDARSVRQALAMRLAPYKLPRVVVVVDALPLTDRGKVDRRAIERLLAGR